MKELFNALINDTVKPQLKQYGFGKKALNFSRKNDELLYLINFQNSLGNSAAETIFYVNCCIHSSVLDERTGRPANPEPKEHQCHFRQRIGQIAGSPVDDFRINAQTDLAAFAKELGLMLDAVQALFEKTKTTADLAQLMIERNGLMNYEQLFDYLVLSGAEEQVRQMARQLHGMLSTDERWSFFEGKMNDILAKRGHAKTLAEML